MSVRKKISVVALACLMLVGAVGGSFAYWNQTASITNPFDTGKYSTTGIEDFKPTDGEDWQPGIKVNKDVYVQNTGDQDVVVRIKIDETWTRKGEDTPYKELTAQNPNGTKNGVYNVKQEDATDGLTANDTSVVTKFFSDSANWKEISPGEDGWFYYAVNLKAGETTDKWLDAVELIEDADMGKFETKNYVSTSEAQPYVWIEYDPADGMPAYYNGATGDFSDEPASGLMKVLHAKAETTYVKADDGSELLGYSNSDYNLKITFETVQATKEAVIAKFGQATYDKLIAAGIATKWVLKEDTTD